MPSLPSASSILDMKYNGELFPENPVQAKSVFKNLVKAYHPDVSKLPHTVMEKINLLYDDFNKNGWKLGDRVTIKDSSGLKELAISYLSHKSFELGEMYISGNSVACVINSKYRKYYDNAIEMIGSISYRDSKVENEIKKYMPNIFCKFETSDGDLCIGIRKTGDVFQLSDVLSFYKNKVPDRHVAWIISRLLNMCCYFYNSGIVHNGLSIDNCFISPQYHSIMVLGGWWYARRNNDPMIGTTKQVYSVVPIDIKTSKRSSIVTDIESTKLIARQLLGGNPTVADAPKPFVDFIKSGSEDNAYNEFAEWSKVLTDSYGTRKFVKMEISQKDIYNKI
jgi:hypothetical protein